MSSLGQFLYIVGGLVVLFGGFAVMMKFDRFVKSPKGQQLLEEYRAEQAKKHHPH
jgi:hypothetical protein